MGQALLEASSRARADKRFDRATLWVLDSNTQARRFYEEAGWTIDGAVKIDDRDSYTLREVRYALRALTWM